MKNRSAFIYSLQCWDASIIFCTTDSYSGCSWLPHQTPGPGLHYQSCDHMSQDRFPGRMTLQVGGASTFPLGPQLLVRSLILGSECSDWCRGLAFFSGSYAHGTCQSFSFISCQLDKHLKTWWKWKKIFSPNFIIAKVVADEEH